MNLRSKIRKLGLLTAPYAVLAAFLGTTNPADLPLVLLLVPFILLFLGLFGTIYYGLRVIPSTKVFSARKRAILAVCLALLPVFLLLLKSINQLTVRDSLIFVVFIVSLVLYIGRTNFLKR